MRLRRSRAKVDELVQLEAKPSSGWLVGQHDVNRITLVHRWRYTGPCWILIDRAPAARIRPRSPVQIQCRPAKVTKRGHQPPQSRCIRSALFVIPFHQKGARLSKVCHIPAEPQKSSDCIRSKMGSNLPERKTQSTERVCDRVRIEAQHPD